MARILLIEDDMITRRLLERMLVKRGHEPTACASAELGLEALQSEFFPVLMVDIQLPGMSGLDFCRNVRARSDGDRYFILVGTGNNRPEDLREILDAGADDYIAKPYQPDLLDVRLTIAERQIVQIAARKELEGELIYLAAHDPLTGMLNRGQLEPGLKRAIDSVRNGGSAALIYLDLDNFKIVNDTLGHEAGDRLLLEVSRRLARHTRAADVLVRFGGDEFVVILFDVGKAEAAAIAERIRGEFETLVFAERSRSFRIGVSIGIAPILPGHTPGDAIAQADAACYAAKAKGRNRVEFHADGVDELARLVADTDWNSRIREGMLDGSVGLWLQPVHRMNGGVSFYETLLRYRDAATGQTIAPGAFLPAVERSGLATILDRFVISEAVRLLATHRTAVFSVNLFGSSMASPDLPAFIAAACSRHGVSCSRLILEITETEIVADLQQAAEHIRSLQSLGCRVAMDDFGTGNCSLAYLRSLRVDIVKIAGVFIEDLLRDRFYQVLVRSIVDVSRLLRCETVAEFVSDTATRELLELMGVHYLQGELSGLAGPPAQFLDRQAGVQASAALAEDPADYPFLHEEPTATEGSFERLG